MCLFFLKYRPSRTLIIGCLFTKRHPFQIRIDEQIQTAVHDSLHITCLRPRPYILHQRIGLEHIGPDLASPGDFLDFTSDARRYSLAFSICMALSLFWNCDRSF